MTRGASYFGVALVSSGVLIYQLTLTRIFSATMYYHFAFMAISLALLGSGAGGVFIYLAGDRLKRRPAEWWLTVFSVAFSITAIASLAVHLRSTISVNAGTENWAKLLLIYLAAAVPLFFAGCAITIAITRFVADVSRLYLFDLAGAASGCLLLIPLLNQFGAVNTVLAVGVMASVAAVLFAPTQIRPIAGAVAVLALTVAVINAITAAVDLRRFKDAEERNLLFAKWNSLSRISVTGRLMDPYLYLAIDAGASTYIFKDAGVREKWPPIAGDVTALAYLLKRNAAVLIIGPGGGTDVVNARTSRQSRITAVEINPIIALDVMSSDPFRSYAGAIYQQPDVELVVDEGRSFIRTSDRVYDIIQASMVDTWAATAAGAFALAENNIYTVEAFEDYWDHLKPDGLLTMTRWYFEPPDQMTRLISLARELMRRRNVANPSQHIVIVKQRAAADRAPATFLLKKSPFSAAELATIERIASRDGFEILYSSNRRPPTIFTRLAEAPDPSAVWDASATNVSPTFDNNPFFFNTLRASNVGLVLTGPEEWRRANLGTVVLFWLIGISAVMVVLFILGPLAVARGGAFAGNTSAKLRLIVYFACLGAGFVLVEVTMIQKFVLFLGHPVYALAVVLFSLLLFSGIGSALTGRWAGVDQRRAITAMTGAVAVMIVLYVLILSPIFYGLVHLPQAGRIAIAVLLIAPLGMAMGMPMPTGIRLASREHPEIVPWGWGVNGAASVMGSVVALAVALFTGFNQALLIGATLYLLAILTVRARLSS